MFSFLKPSGPRVEGIAPSEAVSRAAKGELTVIDVRDISELKASGKAAGALHIPLMLLQSKADPRSPELAGGLDAERPVALYCASGARSQMAGGMLLKMGYSTVYNIGGLGDWRAGGGALERV